jgi:hypothetical protein
MTALSDPMIEWLAKAPDDWQPVNLAVTIEALGRRGLVAIKPMDRHLMCRWQWRITPKGQNARFESDAKRGIK